MGKVAEFGFLGSAVRDRSRLLDQFVLAAATNRAPEGWPTERIGDWFLGRHPRLPAIRLMSEQGALGWMLGYPISDEGRLLADGEVLWVAAEVVESSAALEAWIYAFGGRYAVALLGGGQARFYLDALGSLSAVYCAHQRLVAATPNLVPDDEHTLPRVELARAIGIPHTNGQYPLGLTPRYGIERILPNHYLDLHEWQTIRHWPSRPLDEVASVEAAVGEIASIVKRNIAAIVATTPTYLLLTAGQDSRMLLACARGFAGRLESFTLEAGDRAAAIDCDTAQRIARRFGVRHRVVPMEEATEADLEEWMFRIGYSTGEVRGWQGATMLKRLTGGHALLLGSGGELARGYFWQPDDTPNTVISPERLIGYCLCPPEPALVARARSWLDAVPAVDALQTLDMFFIEQDMGCWGGVFPYADCDPGFEVFPMNHRRVVELMLTLPATYRRAGLLQQHIICREWPELLRWPFNQHVGFSRLLYRMSKVMNRGAAAWHQLRWAQNEEHRGTSGWQQGLGLRNAKPSGGVMWKR